MQEKMGHNVLGDIHLGDWGYQMGLIITELKERKPELPYFDESFKGEYPAEAPFTISELEEIYPTASGKQKRMRSTESVHCMPHIYSRTDIKVIQQSGTTLCMYL